MNPNDVTYKACIVADIRIQRLICQHCRTSECLPQRVSLSIVTPRGLREVSKKQRLALGPTTLLREQAVSSGFPHSLTF
jgi:hypothetical protein